jgi:hypothetical protein
MCSLTAREGTNQSAPDMAQFCPETEARVEHFKRSRVANKGAILRKQAASLESTKLTLSCQITGHLSWGCIRGNMTKWKRHKNVQGAANVDS